MAPTGIRVIGCVLCCCIGSQRETWTSEQNWRWLIALNKNLPSVSLKVATFFFLPTSLPPLLLCCLWAVVSDANKLAEDVRKEIIYSPSPAAEDSTSPKTDTLPTERKQQTLASNEWPAGVSSLMLTWWKVKGKVLVLDRFRCCLKDVGLWGTKAGSWDHHEHWPHC